MHVIGEGAGRLIDFVTPNRVPKLFICAERAQADASVLQNRRLSVLEADEQKIIGLCVRAVRRARHPLSLSLHRRPRARMHK